MSLKTQRTRKGRSKYVSRLDGWKISAYRRRSGSGIVANLTPYRKIGEPVRRARRRGRRKRRK